MGFQEFKVREKKSGGEEKVSAVSAPTIQRDASSLKKKTKYHCDHLELKARTFSSTPLLLLSPLEFFRILFGFPCWQSVY